MPRHSVLRDQQVVCDTVTRALEVWRLPFKLFGHHFVTEVDCQEFSLVLLVMNPWLLAGRILILLGAMSGLCSGRE